MDPSGRSGPARCPSLISPGVCGAGDSGTCGGGQRSFFIEIPLWERCSCPAGYKPSAGKKSGLRRREMLPKRACLRCGCMSPPWGIARGPVVYRDRVIRRPAAPSVIALASAAIGAAVAFREMRADMTISKRSRSMPIRPSAGQARSTDFTWRLGERPRYARTAACFR